jgi:hypothetical protein
MGHRADALRPVDGHLDERGRGQNPRPPAPVADLPDAAQRPLSADRS